VDCKKIGMASFDIWGRGYKAELRKNQGGGGKKKDLRNSASKSGEIKGYPQLHMPTMIGLGLFFSDKLSKISRAETANSATTALFH